MPLRLGESGEANTLRATLSSVFSNSEDQNGSDVKRGSRIEPLTLTATPAGRRTPLRPSH